ncbi:hypothetical protein AMTR_s00190p00014490 [Amborella trichopoda]|uniref:ACT domain-containing protein ACR n=1 Tax=Amborella trichopoda TaxID=13333 RepID=U5D7J3_AMBTC|nr:hypothetical protein AMTR_s00190p00014490 [Amborella trichopoda]
MMIREQRPWVGLGMTHIERRLHQMMFTDRDYERKGCGERGYSVVSVSCEDRPKLLLDVVCTLTDMDYVVFYGMVDTKRVQEFYKRHTDRYPVLYEVERQNGASL